MLLSSVLLSGITFRFFISSRTCAWTGLQRVMPLLPGYWKSVQVVVLVPQRQYNSHPTCDSVNGLINAIYPGISQGNKPDDYFLHRTILSPKNDAVDNINQSILDTFPGQQTTITSIDKVINMENIYPVEFLHSLKASGLPLAHLTLKPGCPLMLLRNLDVANGLCNGTRMILLAIKPRVVQCRILGGKHAGHTVFIPRITIEPSAEDMPIPLSRRQFPVRLAFSMTINKSQGQSVTHVGLDLRVPVFSHGQLYVALSRCTSGNRIKVIFPQGSNSTSTTNIVYPELLNGILDPWYMFLQYCLQLKLTSSFL